MIEKTAILPLRKKVFMKDDDNSILLLEKGKRGLLQIIFGRTGIIIVSLIVQILFLFLAFYKLEGAMPYFWGGNTLLSAAIVLSLFGNDDNPTIKLTWFFILSVLPVFGLILYLYIRTDLGHRLMIRRYNDIQAQTKDLIPSPAACQTADLPPETQGLAAYLERCGFPAYRNTDAEYFPLGDDAFGVMLDELKKAEHFIFLEYFIVSEGYMWGRILEILTEKVKQGVEVRFMYDGTCAVALLPYSYPEKLRKLGIACKMFAPLRPFVSTHYNYRDHRKILVIDGGFSKAYQKETGIAGYTLTYNSYGLILSALEPFESTEAAIEREIDIHSDSVIVRHADRRKLVGDTDTGAVLREKIADLEQLLMAYHSGLLVERYVKN